MISLDIARRIIPGEFLPQTTTCNEEDWEYWDPRVIAQFDSNYIRTADPSPVSIPYAVKVLGEKLSGDAVMVSFLMDATPVQTS